MGVEISYKAQKAILGQNELISYDERELKNIATGLVAGAVSETLLSKPIDSIFFPSYEIRRAVDLYAEEFCLFVEDTLAAFWAVRRGIPSVGLPIWLQNSSSEYTSAAIEGAMGEAVSGYLLERLYLATLHHRPRGRSPDIYMILPNDKRATVEAKATVKIDERSLDNRVAEAVFDTLDIWAHIDAVESLENLMSFCIGVSIGQEILEARILRLEYQRTGSPI